MEPILRAKVKIVSKVKILKNAFNEKWWPYRVYIRQKKICSGCHHSLLVYDASKLSTVYVVKWPVLGLQWAPENLEFDPSV